MNSLSPSYLAEPVVSYLQKVLEEIRAGVVLIPRFQRDPVWKDSQKLELLRSVHSGIPIGSLMVWRTDHDLETVSSIGGFRLTPAIKPASKQYLLDGLQRMSTLIDALTPLGDLTASTYFDLEENDFVFPRRKPIPATWMPCDIIFDSVRLISFQRQLNDDELIRKSEHLASSFRNYKLPVIPIVSDDLEFVTKAFQRINSGGTSMSDVHMVRALTYTESFDLGKKLESASQKLAQNGWEGLDEKYILATMRALSKLSISDPNADQLSNAIKSNPHLTEEATAALISAGKFLEDACGVSCTSVLPYSYQLVLLAAATVTASSRNSGRRGLASWFWYTSYTSFFVYARSKQMRGSLALLGEIADGSPVSMKIAESDKQLPSKFNFNSARSKAFCLALGRLNPRDIWGDLIDLPDIWRSFGSDAMQRIVTDIPFNIDAVDGPENRIISYPKSSEDLIGHLMSGRCSLEELKSHALDELCVGYYREGAWDDFLNHRRSLINGIEDKLLMDFKLLESAGRPDVT
ncbi:MAG: DUF262 domain-containing protein [Proteobacteria bacterium]|nr:MAG: DUF262 domain-containing protein [Pseudomonadota bacterium]